MKLITIPDLKAMIRQVGIDAFLQQTLNALEDAFEHWHEFSKSPRHATHYPQGVIELMPCANRDFYSFKYVNGHPKNTQQGRLSVTAVGLLAETDSGYPLMISEMTLLTAIRTAATGALGAKHLARPESHRLAIIGTGAQAEFQLMAMQPLFPITQVTFYDPDPQAMAKFARNLTGKVDLIACTSIEQAVAEADIVITATAAKKHNQLITTDMLKPGTHINGMGGDCPGKTELDPELLTQCKIVVEYLPQSREEGEIQLMKELPVYAELWELVCGQKPGRENSEELTLFDCVGFALEDYAVLRQVYQLASDLGIGEEVELVPSLDNPKDLYGFLMSP
ncbi:MAG: ornithine cyclodeaminase [Sedimenticola sp.]|nr:ornithine cyclodeaminase [Sedimenticola sp.]